MYKRKFIDIKPESLTSLLLCSLTLRTLLSTHFYNSHFFFLLSQCVRRDQWHGALGGTVWAALIYIPTAYLRFFVATIVEFCGKQEQEQWARRGREQQFKCSDSLAKTKTKRKKKKNEEWRGMSRRGVQKKKQLQNNNRCSNFRCYCSQSANAIYSPTPFFAAYLCPFSIVILHVLPSHSVVLFAQTRLFGLWSLLL